MSNRLRKSPCHRSVNHGNPRMSGWVAVALATMVGLAGCTGGSNTTTVADSTDPFVANNKPGRATIEPVVDGVLVLPDGWFELAGYGAVLHVNGDEITQHHVTASTCTVGDSFDNELAVDHANDDGTITLDLVGPTTDYHLLELTDDPDCDTDQDVVVALDEAFRTHYPFFAEHGIDWHNEIATIRTATDTDPDAFEDAFTSFLMRLGDGHTTTDDLDIDPDPAAFGVPGISTIDEVAALADQEITDTLDRLETYQFDETGAVGWGQLTDDIGYLIIAGFEGSADRDDAVADRAALTAALDTAIADLDATFEKLIVDVRFNGGGYEDLAVLAAGYFTEQQVPAYRKWAHAQPDPVVQTVEVTPAGVVFDGDVAVLSSPITASAAEAFLLAMRQVADATIVGTPSFGEFSDAIDWVLPNGTAFTMSMEIYTDLDGTNYEAKGVPVNLAAPFDQTVDTAIDHLTS